MDVDSCIAAYSELAQDVFGKTRRGKVRRVCNLMSQGSMYSAEKLEIAIKKVIRGALGAEPDDVPLRGSEDTGCKVYLSPTPYNLYWDEIVDHIIVLKLCLCDELRQLDPPTSSQLPIE